MAENFTLLPYCRVLSYKECPRAENALYSTVAFAYKVLVAMDCEEIVAGRWPSAVSRWWKKRKKMKIFAGKNWQKRLRAAFYGLVW